MKQTVEKIEKEEELRKKLLADIEDDQERIKVRKSNIEAKAACQKQIKDIMKKHKEESDYLEMKVTEERKESIRKQKGEVKGEVKGDVKGEEKDEEEGEEEQQDEAGDEEMLGEEEA